MSNQQVQQQYGQEVVVSSSPECYADVEKPKPKSATTALGFFTRAKKESFRRDHPNEKINNPEFTKQCSAEWKTLSEEDRAPFVALANDDADRYENEMVEYDPTYTTSKRKRSLKDKDPNQPKRPISAFFIFSAEKRQEIKDANPEWKYTQIAQELGRMWNNLTDEEKQPYRAKGEAVKTEYNLKMAEYNQKKLDMESAAVAPTA